MTKNKKLALLCGAVLLIIAAAMGLLYANSYKTTKGDKTIQVQVVIEGQETRDFTIPTDAEYLLGALQQMNLVEGEQQPTGFYITTVNGVTADTQKQQWWCITKGGEMVMVGVGELPIADGDAFELTLMTGW